MTARWTSQANELSATLSIWSILKYLTSTTTRPLQAIGYNPSPSLFRDWIISFVLFYRIFAWSFCSSRAMYDKLLSLKSHIGWLYWLRRPQLDYGGSLLLRADAFPNSMPLSLFSWFVSCVENGRTHRGKAHWHDRMHGFLCLLNLRYSNDANVANSTSVRSMCKFWCSQRRDIAWG